METDIRHLQLVILSIIKDIDSLCNKNGIEYYLLGGSTIGAIRHKGFIPWDDDLDIIMTDYNYNRFLKICQEQLDKNKYTLEVGLKDWPLYFSKIRLNGTILREQESSAGNLKHEGIYVDIFKLDNVSNNYWIRYWQYFCAKYYLCYQLGSRTYKSANLKKRIMIILAYPLRVALIRNYLKGQVEKYNSSETDYFGFFYGRTNFKNAIIKKEIYGIPLRVPFEDTMLPVQEYYHKYLTQTFGDYMKLPPINQQVGLHAIYINFGKY